MANNRLVHREPLSDRTALSATEAHLLRPRVSDPGLKG
jgi:hypothetical protein